MKILTFADLHLGDRRNSPEYDDSNLNNLALLVRGIAPDMVVNIGDTVSKDEYLRNPEEKMDYWRRYVDFRSDLSVPVLETCLARERAFFSEMFGRECDHAFVKDGIGFVSFDPLELGDHSMTPRQIRWFTEEVEKLSGSPIVFASHVPVAQTTLLRGVEPVVYLTQSDLIRGLAEKHAKPAVFLGGHFHTPLEPPRMEGAAVMLMAGCFAFETSTDSSTTYYRNIEISDNKLRINTVDSLNH